MKTQATILLNRVSEAVPVRWDRLTDEGPRLSVYGWIPHPCPRCNGGGRTGDEVDGDEGPCEECLGSGEDRRADFVLVRFEPYPDDPRKGLLVAFFTSSAEHSKPISRAIWGELADDIHVDCKRVEDELPGVEAAIKL